MITALTVFLWDKATNKKDFEEASEPAKVFICSLYCFSILSAIGLDIKITWL